MNKNDDLVLGNKGEITMKQVLDNPEENQKKKKSDHLNMLTILSAFMVTTYLTANIMAVKLIDIFGVTLFDAGTITFPIAFMLGDVLTEIWGFRTARRVIFLTFACNVFLVLSTTIGLFLPSPVYLEEITQAYTKIFTVVPRILVASLVAFLSGELTNAWFMVKIKELTEGRHLWIRTILSSAIGYLFDTVVFVLIAFSGVAPAKDLFTMISAQYIIKLAIETIGGTPLAYALIAYIKKKEGNGRCE
mgnify:CR=1 FL=1